MRRALEDAHLGSLHRQREPRPSSRQLPQFEGSRLHGVAPVMAGVVKDNPLRTILHLRQGQAQLHNLQPHNRRGGDRVQGQNEVLSGAAAPHQNSPTFPTYLLQPVCDSEEHAAVLRGRLGGDADGKVVVEGVGDVGCGGAAHCVVGAEAVGRVAFEARDEGDGGRERDADQLRQVQDSLRTLACQQTQSGSSFWFWV